MDPIGVVRRYAASGDKRVAAANLVALVLAWNTPFYPVWLLVVAGSSMFPGGWLTLLAFPLFLAVPAVTRRDPLWGRVLLMLTATINTVFCTWLLGEASGTQVFLLPCITLAALVFRRGEQTALFSLVTLPIVLGFALHGRYPASPFACADAACAQILWMNAVSAAVLFAFLGIQATGMAEPGSPG